MCEEKKILINVIFGDSLNEKMDNIENFYSNFIPQIGSRIYTKRFGNCTVKDVLIDYRNIQYDNPDDMGTEMVFVFVS